MRVVTMLDAETNLSELVKAVESGDESEIIIARNGRPAARLVAVSKKLTRPRRLGLLEGKFPPMSLEAFNAHDGEVARLFYGEDE